MTPDQITLLRLIKRSACVLLALLHCDQPTTALQLSSLTDINYETTRNHLNELVAHGLADRSLDGYLPTDKAAQLIPIKSYPQVYAQTVDNPQRGKSATTRKIRDRNPNLQRGKSATTRKIRAFTG
jgi:hypothetical protein